MTGSIDDAATTRPGASARAVTRFVWRTDAEGRLLEVHPAMAILLRMPVHQTGRPFPVLIEEAGADADGRLAAALTGGKTFSGVRILWPAADDSGEIELEWGGVPQRDTDQSFDGFRGFAVVKARALRVAPAIESASSVVPDAEGPVEDMATAEQEPDRPDNVVPLRPIVSEAASVPVLRRADRAASLTDEERGALAEIAAFLGPPLSPAGQREHSAATPRPESSPDLFGENFRRVVDLVPIGILVSRDGTVAFANRTLLDLTGFADADALHDAGGLDRLFGTRDPARGEGSGNNPVQLRTRESEAIPVDVRVHAINWDGLPATLLSMRSAVDRVAASRARELEVRLREREGEARELHTILDTATDGIVILDAEDGILSLNRSAEALFGCDGAEVAGKPFETLVADESRAVLADYLAGLKGGGVASLLNDGREILCKDPRGGLIPVFVTLGRVGSDAPKYCAVLRDLTAWKNAEQGLTKARTDAERASAEKSEFLARISHEIRTPLNAILGFAEVMMDERFGPIGNDRYRDYMKDIHRSGEHVMSLVNDLLDLSKIEAGKMDMTFTAVDANACVSDCVALMQPQASRARVVIRLSLAPRLPKVIADDRAMKQIVLNVLSNAVKYNESGGQVIVSTARTDAGHAVVRIRDTGLGMTENEVHTALEPFGQVQTSRQTTGTGLGLPLTKALVEANRANFTIKSRKGEGTLVEIAFPPSRIMAE